MPVAPDVPIMAEAEFLASEALGQPFVFENRPGANSFIGADTVAKSAPDGYTFGTIIAAHAVNASLNPKLPYDVLKDFSYISLMSVAPLIMVAHPALPANNVQERQPAPFRQMKTTSVWTCFLLVLAPLHAEALPRDCEKGQLSDVMAITILSSPPALQNELRACGINRLSGQRSTFVKNSECHRMRSLLAYARAWH